MLLTLKDSKSFLKITNQSTMFLNQQSWLFTNSIKPFYLLDKNNFMLDVLMTSTVTVKLRTGWLCTHYNYINVLEIVLVLMFMQKYVFVTRFTCMNRDGHFYTRFLTCKVIVFNC